MITDKNLMHDEQVFTGELRFSDDQILQAWIVGAGSAAAMKLREIDSSGTVVMEWPEIPAKHLSLLKVIVGNTIGLMCAREDYAAVVRAEDERRVAAPQ
jgi:hypothetical protein